MNLIVTDQSHAVIGARSISDEEWIGGSPLPGADMSLVRRVPGDWRTLFVAIPGQICDEWARVVIEPEAAGIQIYDGPHPGCDSMGIAWTAALTFDRDLAFDAFQVSAAGWPWEDAVAADLPELAQRITRSLGPTVVIESEVVAKGENGEVVRIVLGGRYRFCTAEGACDRAVGHEVFGLTTDRPQLRSYRVVEGLP
jgi:hypothetical protein